MKPDWYRRLRGWQRRRAYLHNPILLRCSRCGSECRRRPARWLYVAQQVGWLLFGGAVLHGTRQNLLYWVVLVTLCAGWLDRDPQAVSRVVGVEAPRALRWG